MTNLRFRFGDCVIDAQTRTISRRDEVRDIEPKVFDVILRLMANRHRVVTKQELLEKVWGKHVVVTEGVVARTVMKARRYVGDDADAPTIIKTIHRVGYRFVASVEEMRIDEGTSAAADTDPARGRPDERVAVLPFRDETGSPNLAWIDLGLMSTTIDAIAARGGDAAVVPAADVLAVVGVHDASLDLKATARKVTAVLGVQEVIEAVLSKDAQGELTLAYAGIGPRLSALQGAFLGSDPIDLCHRLATEIRKIHSRGAVAEPAPPGADASTTPWDVPGDTRFAHRAHARALQAMLTESWGLARKLLRVGLDASPEEPAMLLDYSRCLLSQRDPQATTLLETTLKVVRAAGDTALELRALHFLAIARQAAGDFAESERLFTEALSLAERLGDQEAELHLLVSIAHKLTCEGRPAVASWMLDRASLLARALGNRVAMARVLDIRGRIAAFRNDQPGALQSFREAAKLSELHGLHSGSAFSVAHIAYCLVNEGRMSEAASNFEHAYHHACQSGNLSAIGLAGCAVVRYGDLRRGDLAHAGIVLKQMRDAGEAAGWTELAEAFVLSRKGRLDACAAMLDGAAQKAFVNSGVAYHVGKHRIRTLVYLGRLEEAAELCDEFRSRSNARFKQLSLGTTLHIRALIARAGGSAARALQYLNESQAAFSPSAEQADARLDAAWLHFEAREPDAAERLLDELHPFMHLSLASEYGPSMLVQARRLFEIGDFAGAAALQARYCELLSCPPDSDAHRCLSVYQTASPRTGRKRPPPIGALPSLFELVPGMGVDAQIFSPAKVELGGFS